MNHVTAIIAALIIIGLVFAVIAGIAAIIGVGEEDHQEMDDQDQIEYIRRWQEEKKEEAARKHNKRQGR